MAMMEKEDRASLRVSIAMNNIANPISELINALLCLDNKDEEITALNAKIKSIRKTAFEMIDMQTDKIVELRSGYVASQACNEKQRVRIVELEQK